MGREEGGVGMRFGGGWIRESRSHDKGKSHVWEGGKGYVTLLLARGNEEESK